MSVEELLPLVSSCHPSYSPCDLSEPSLQSRLSNSHIDKLWILTIGLFTLKLINQHRHHLKQVANDAVVGYFKNRRIGVTVLLLCCSSGDSFWPGFSLSEFYGDSVSQRFISAFIYLGYFGISKHLLNGVIAHVTNTTKNLHGIGSDLHRHV